jgi:hypothetical protein
MPGYGKKVKREIVGERKTDRQKERVLCISTSVWVLRTQTPVEIHLKQREL